MGAGAVARFEKAEIVRFESGTDAPESSVDLPQPAVPIEIDSSRHPPRGAGWIERDVQRVWTLEVSLRCALKGINRFGSSALTRLPEIFPVTQSRWPSTYIRVSAEYICAIDERRPEHRRVESARDGRCHQQRRPFGQARAAHGRRCSS